MQCKRVRLVAGGRIDLADQRIMSRDDTVGMTGQAVRDIPALEHVAEIVDDRKRAAAMHVAVVMGGVRGQHHRAARGLDPHHLQAVGVAADAVQGHARRDLAVAIVEGDTFVEDVAHHQRDVFHRERKPQQAWHMQRPVAKLISRSCR